MSIVSPKSSSDTRSSTTSELDLWRLHIENFNPGGKISILLLQWGHGSFPFNAGDVIEGEIEGIGVLRNPLEDIDVDRTYAQQINVEDIV